MPFFKENGVTEICINRPGAVFVERYSEWTRHAIPELDFDRCFSLAIAIATYTEQGISGENPLLSATLPSGERVQIVIPPACPRNTVSITIRLPSHRIKDLVELEEEGFFDHVHWVGSIDSAKYPPAPRLNEDDQSLIRTLEARRFRSFFADAVKFRKNIAVIGDTGSGKTTFMKSICQSIPVVDRIITIEDVRELFLPKHPNCVHLLYNKGGQGLSAATPSSLIASTMRMKPDRVILAELRGAEAFDFLKLLTTGHAGSVTSYHAQSCSLAFERFALMAKEHPEAAIHTDETLQRLLHLTLDVVVYVRRNGTRREVSEIYFDPIRKQSHPSG
ncbi:P-type DNA transfer ATPase VirB11 [Cupriavidus necator]